MTDSKKKRMSMLDTLAAASAPTTAGSMMTSNRALRSARDAVDSHHVWDLDPDEIEDNRFLDRLNPEDVEDLRASIEANGQTVPILVRRHPTADNHYLLVYGRRRLEAVRSSDKVAKIRALIANIDDTAALRAQVSENTGRRDLSFIERALFAQELLGSGFGAQADVAQVLNMTRSAVSMSIAVARAIGPDLAQAIGPAHGIGRPRWEALTKDLAQSRHDTTDLCKLAREAREKAAMQQAEEADDSAANPSVAAFEAVQRRVAKGSARADSVKTRLKPASLMIDGAQAGTLKKTAQGLRLDLTDIDDGFADWLENQAQDVLQELHTRWQRET